MATATTSLVARIFGKSRNQSGRRPRRSFQLESLEGRVAPSDLLGVGYSSGGAMINSIITITSTSTGSGSGGSGSQQPAPPTTPGGGILISGTPFNPGTTQGPGGGRA